MIITSTAIDERKNQFLTNGWRGCTWDMIRLCKDITNPSLYPSWPCCAESILNNKMHKTLHRSQGFGSLTTWHGYTFRTLFKGDGNSWIFSNGNEVLASYEFRGLPRVIPVSHHCCSLGQDFWKGGSGYLAAPNISVQMCPLIHSLKTDFSLHQYHF